jgi:hypothetical protein
MPGRFSIDHFLAVKSALLSQSVWQVNCKALMESARERRKQAIAIAHGFAETYGWHSRQARKVHISERGSDRLFVRSGFEAPVPPVIQPQVNHKPCMLLRSSQAASDAASSPHKHRLCCGDRVILCVEATNVNLRVPVHEGDDTNDWADKFALMARTVQSFPLLRLPRLPRRTPAFEINPSASRFCSRRRSRS